MFLQYKNRMGHNIWSLVVAELIHWCDCPRINVSNMNMLICPDIDQKWWVLEGESCIKWHVEPRLWLWSEPTSYSAEITWNRSHVINLAVDGSHIWWKCMISHKILFSNAKCGACSSACCCHNQVGGSLVMCHVIIRVFQTCLTQSSTWPWTLVT